MQNLAIFRAMAAHPGNASAWPSCVAFHSMHKSAGLTFVTVLSHIVHQVLHGTLLKCEQQEWSWELKRCPDGGDVMASRQPRLLIKGHSLSMAATGPWMQPTCKWVTLFREPISRSISAYFYCKLERPIDPLCGHTHFNFHNQSYGDFASFWSDFGFREMLLHPALRGTAVDHFNATGLPTSRTSTWTGVPVWYAWKRAVTAAWGMGAALSEARFGAVKAALEGGKLFDYIGVVERFDDTCRLLDTVLPLPPSVIARGDTFRKLASRLSSSHGSQRYKAQELSTLASARQDPAVHASLSVDIQLYETVVLPMFDRQMTAVGLSAARSAPPTPS